MVVVKLRTALATSLAAQGETSRALAMYRSVLTELSRVDGGNEKCGRLMAARVASSAASLHLSAGEYAEARTVMRDHLAVPQDSSIDEPSRIDLAIEILDTGMALAEAEGRTSGALALIEQFCTALTSGPAQSNGSWRARLDLLRAPLVRAEGMSSVALQLASAAKTALLEHIARDGRFVPSASSLLCIALLELGYSQLETSDPLSMESFREAAVVARSLQEHDPDDYTYMDLMARAQCGIAQGLVEAGDPVSGLAAADLAVSAATDACCRCASDLMCATVLAHALLVRGDAQESMDLHEDALKSWRLGLEKLRIPSGDRSPSYVTDISATLEFRLTQPQTPQ